MMMSDNSIDNVKYLNYFVSTYLSELCFFTADPLIDVLRPGFCDEPAMNEG